MQLELFYIKNDAFQNNSFQNNASTNGAIQNDASEKDATQIIATRIVAARISLFHCNPGSRVFSPLDFMELLTSWNLMTSFFKKQTFLLTTGH